MKKEIKDITPININRMNYNELIGLLKETNRPPGGTKSIFYILDRLFINQKSKILEVGTSTGFVALEIATLTKSNIKSIDINEIALEEAKRRAKRNGCRIKFIKADVRNLPFKNEYFDLVFCGNLLSIINEKEKAFGELRRVTKMNGFLAVIPMYYLNNPPKKLVKEVSDIIKADIKVRDKNYWLNFLSNSYFEIYSIKDFRFDKISQKKVKEFVNQLLSRKYLRALPLTSMKALRKKYGECMLLFRENLSYMGYSIIILRKTNRMEDPELFTSTEVK